MAQDPSKPEVDRPVGYLVYPWSVEDLATAEHILPLIEKLHHKGYAPLIASIYLCTTNFYTWDRQIARAFLKKADIVLLVCEEHMTLTMLWELERARRYGKPIVRIAKEGV